MNIKTYFGVIKKGKWMIVVVTLIVAAAATVFSMVAPPRYESATTLTVSRVNREASEDFQYDNYYAIQSAEFVSNTVSGMLAAPDVVQRIYDVAGVESDDSIQAKTKSISARQKTSHLISLSVKRSSQEEADSIIQATEEVLRNRVEALEVTKNSENAFTLTGGDIIRTTLVYSPVIVFISSLISGLFLGVGFVFLKHYLSTE